MSVMPFVGALAHAAPALRAYYYISDCLSPASFRGALTRARRPLRSLPAGTGPPPTGTTPRSTPGPPSNWHATIDSSDDPLRPTIRDLSPHRPDVRQNVGVIEGPPDVSKVGSAGKLYGGASDVSRAMPSCRRTMDNTYTPPYLPVFHGWPSARFQHVDRAGEKGSVPPTRGKWGSTARMRGYLIRRRRTRDAASSKVTLVPSAETSGSGFSLR
jgi:hypothetical protein